MKKGISIQNKIFLSSAFIIVSALLVTALLINTVSANVSIRNATDASQRELTLVSNNLNSQLIHIYDYAVSIAVDYRVTDTMKRNPELPQDSIKRYELHKTLNKTVSSIMGLNRSIYMWDLVSADGTFYQVGGYYNMRQVRSVLPPDYFKTAGAQLGVSISGPYLIGDDLKSTIAAFLVVKPIVDLETRQLLGYVLFTVRESTFASVFEDNIPTDSTSSFYILDGQNTVVSSSEKEKIAHDFTGIDLLNHEELCRLEQSGTLLKQVDRVEMLFSMERNVSGKTNWKAINCQPLDLLLSGQNLMVRAILLIGSLACLVALFFSYLISRSISRPILQLAHTIYDAAKGDMSQKADKRFGGEIQVLYSGFNRLMSTVNQLLRRVCREQEEKSEYQFHLIQAQIKPHFLYNTLEMIQSLIDLDMGGTAGQCISALASFYRLSLNRGNDIIAVSDEVKLSEQYMYIQKLRYIEYLDYCFTIPKDLGAYSLPKMTLQPILENAIYHGIKEKQADGMVLVNLREEADMLVFTVEDNGAGMETETLTALQTSIRDSEPPKSFGLTSINRRLRLLYGENYRFEIDSRWGEYTCVTLAIPKSCNLSNGENKGKEDLDEKENPDY